MSDSPVVALLAAGGGALLIALAVTPFVGRLAGRAGLLDYPDGRRKLQTRPVPKAGGLAVLIATLATLTGVALLWPDLADALMNGGQVWSLLGAAVFIALVGLADDAWDLRGRYKLLGQLVAISMLVFPGGLYIDTVNLFGLRVDLGVLGLGFTVFWMLACINALNLIDGMDGLLGVVGTIVCLTLAVIGVLSGKWAVALIGATLAGSLVGFLAFNLPPARVYLGDSGSMVIGLVVGAVSMESCLKGPTAVALVVPASLLIIPILDTGAALIRRVLTGRSIYISDRGHLHHCLLRNGLTRGQILLFVGSLGVVAAGGAVLSHLFRTDVFAILGAAAVAGILVASRQFGTAELRLVSERARGVLAALLHGRAAGRSHNLEVHLQGSAGWNEIWLRLTAAAEGLRLRGLQLDVNLPAIHEGYHARWQRFGTGNNEAALWRAEVPLFMGDQVIGRLTAVGCRDGGSAWYKLARLATIADQAEQEASVLAAGARLPSPSRPAPALQSIA
jgi:UDP-GlcNAc:undecaprenyl-phosphate/decaprenyl-phosphate GlcNAc-1-phosphate transferase